MLTMPLQWFPKGLASIGVVAGFRSALHQCTFLTTLCMQDVTKIPPKKKDSMESFWLSGAQSAFPYIAVPAFASEHSSRAHRISLDIAEAIPSRRSLVTDSLSARKGLTVHRYTRMQPSVSIGKAQQKVTMTY